MARDMLDEHLVDDVADDGGRSVADDGIAGPAAVTVRNVAEVVVARGEVGRCWSGVRC